MLTEDDAQKLKKLAVSLKYATYRPPAAMSAEDAVDQVGFIERAIRSPRTYDAEEQWDDLDELRMCAEFCGRKGIERAEDKAQSLVEECEALIDNLNLEAA